MESFCKTFCLAAMVWQRWLAMGAAARPPQGGKPPHCVRAANWPCAEWRAQAPLLALLGWGCVKGAAIEEALVAILMARLAPNILGEKSWEQTYAPVGNAY